LDLSAYTSNLVLGYIMVVARLGSALMFLPGFGEVQIPVRARLSFVLVLCAALYPVVPISAQLPEEPIALLGLLGAEVTIGLWIGLTARVLLTAMQFAGFQIGQVSGLANAFGPSLGSFEGATLVATLLLLAAVVMIFITNTHHLILRALLDSYVVFPPGVIISGDLASQIVKAGGHSFYIGTAISAPFFVMGVILNLGMGLANRMMPQLPVFFVAASILIGVGLLILAIATPSMLEFFIQDFQQWITGFQL
jgi:flagellar biosynthetic protein FliR